MPVRRVLWILFLLLPLLFFGCKTESFYPQIVIDTVTDFPAHNENDTYIILYDASGNLIAEDDDSNPDQTNHKGCSRINYTGGLSSGTYYIKVNNPTATGNPNYGIRVLDYDPGASLPSITGANENDGYSDDNAVGNVPTNPVPIYLDDVLSRSIFPLIDDVDWFVLVLP